MTAYEPSKSKIKQKNKKLKIYSNQLYIALPEKQLVPPFIVDPICGSETSSTERSERKKKIPRRYTQKKSEFFFLFLLTFLIKRRHKRIPANLFSSSSFKFIVTNRIIKQQKKEGFFLWTLILRKEKKLIQTILQKQKKWNELFFGVWKPSKKIKIIKKKSSTNDNQNICILE